MTLPQIPYEMFFENPGGCPYRALALAVLHRALLDLWQDFGLMLTVGSKGGHGSKVKREARKFIASHDCNWWADIAGVDVRQIRTLATLKPATRFVVRRDNRD